MSMCFRLLYKRAQCFYCSWRAESLLWLQHSGSHEQQWLSARTFGGGGDKDVHLFHSNNAFKQRKTTQYTKGAALDL